MPYFAVTCSSSHDGLGSAVGTTGFVGEFLVILGTFDSHPRPIGIPALVLTRSSRCPSAVGVVLGAREKDKQWLFPAHCWGRCKPA